MPANIEKAKGLHHLETCLQPLPPTNEPVVNVIDGNVKLYVLSLIPDIFQGVAETVLDRLAKSSSVDFVTDISNENSIKSFDGKRRGTQDLKHF